jgi:hypothetical protein
MPKQYVSIDRVWDLLVDIGELEQKVVSERKVTYGVGLDKLDKCLVELFSLRTLLISTCELEKFKQIQNRLDDCKKAVRRYH